MANILILYHSQEYGHTEKMAQAVAQGATGAGAKVRLVNTNRERLNPEDYRAFDAAAFGSPPGRLPCGHRASSLAHSRCCATATPILKHTRDDCSSPASFLFCRQPRQPAKNRRKFRPFSLNPVASARGEIVLSRYGARKLLRASLRAASLWLGGRSGPLETSKGLKVRRPAWVTVGQGPFWKEVISEIESYR